MFISGNILWVFFLETVLIPLPCFWKQQMHYVVMQAVCLQSFSISLPSLFLHLGPHGNLNVV